MTKAKNKIHRILGCLWLTDADGGKESGGDVWRQAIQEGRLQDVIGEGECDDSQCCWVHDEYGAPQQQEAADQRDKENTCGF